MQPFRFIHAANLLLDHDFRCSRKFDGTLESLTEDCTLAAFQRIVEKAVAERVDFLLLAGNSFDAADHSLRGQLALVRGIEQLAEHAIPVYIVPGETDPSQAWRAGLPLPRNAVIFLEPTDSPQCVERDGTVIASIQGITGTGHCPMTDHGESPFSIVVRYGKTSSRFGAAEQGDAGEPRTEHQSADDAHRGQPKPPEVSQQELATSGIHYWALGTGDARRTVSVRDAVAHHPGGPQGLSVTQTGPHGCTLVEVDREGTPSLTFVPAAPIRWESLDVAVTREMCSEELFQRFKEAVAEIPGHPTDVVYLLSWTIAGEGSLRDLVAEPEFCLQIDEFLRAEFSACGIQFQSIVIVATAPNGANETPEALCAMEAEYLEQLTSPPHETPVDLGSLLARSSLAGGPWQGHLQEFSEEISDHLVFTEAMQYRHAWFGERFGEEMEKSA